MYIFWLGELGHSSMVLQYNSRPTKVAIKRHPETKDCK